jgi:HD-GYP domain-containing protein (c-di-GMP phosphodiesterase class II)
MASAAAPAVSLADGRSARPDRLAGLVEVSRLLASEVETMPLLERILLVAREAAHADGGTVYLVEDGRGVRYAVAVSDKLGLHIGGTSRRPVDIEAPPLFNEDGSPNHRAVIAHCVHERRTLNVADAYRTEGRDYAAARAFDERYSYRTQSVLTVPMIDHEGAVIGVLQLVNAGAAEGTIRPFSADEQRYIEALAAQAGIALEKHRLIERLQVLFESLVRLVNEAIDEKSPYTGAHCRRVPALAMMLAEAAHRTETGPLAAFRISEADRREIRLAALLHDCGKIATPVHVVDKATKLETIFDRIALVEARLDLAESEAKVALLEAIANGESRAAAESRYRETIDTLAADRAFLREANRGSERMRDEDIERVQAIAGRRLGDSDRGSRPLLTDDEVANLTIRSGTLTHAEREIINRHVTTTIRMLEALPWPRQLARVPEYAGAHHERVDGKGYPRGLKREQMSWPARIVALADVFEALTAGDRPYKPARSIAESLTILGKMKLAGHIDPDLFDVFVREGVYAEYARKFLDPAQLAELDVTQLT